MTDVVSYNFSWAGRKQKQCFQDLHVFKIVKSKNTQVFCVYTRETLKFSNCIFIGILFIHTELFLTESLKESYGAKDTDVSDGIQNFLRHVKDPEKAQAKMSKHGGSRPKSKHGHVNHEDEDRDSGDESRNSSVHSESDGERSDKSAGFTDSD